MPRATTTLRSPDATAAPARHVIGAGDPSYPAALRDLRAPPEQLWAQGATALATHPHLVAIVGTRGATEYGERVTRELTRALAQAGACVVSGMARGIDALAHRTALAAGAPTIAVIATGIDIAYPVGHRVLQATIARDGLLLAEQPPGTRAFKGSFPRRNRIIAALAPTTIVVEAGLKSGAINTAEWALDLGRTVGAVPGPIDAPQSEGCNHLLRDGASPIASIADAVTLAGLTRPVRLPREFAEPDVAAVWNALGRGGCDADTLCVRSRLPAERCLAAVTELELLGAVECTLTGTIHRR